LHSPRVFFKQKEKKVDALLYFAEAGSAWTLIYPSYSIAVPHPVIIKIPLVYTLPSGSLQWKEYVNSWIALKVKDGTVERVFKYWIEGEGAKPKTKRWSVIRDVLHWVD
jgi:ABC-type amino acid transport substrate-binding protein